MIYTKKLKIDSSSKEILPGRFEDDLFACIKMLPRRFSHNTIPWHWHDVFELYYVMQGEIEFHTASQKCTVSRGSIIFVNQGTLHNFSCRDSATVYALLFDSRLLSGSYGSSLERKYILPLKESGLPFFEILPDSEQHQRMSQSVLKCIEWMSEEPFGFEMRVRSELSLVWLDLLEETKDYLLTFKNTSLVDHDRLKNMMNFISRHYGEKITIGQVAAAASISERECCRCFTRSIGMSPVKYLNDYRLHAAADLLLTTDLPILEISETCGFQSPSYFGKLFLSSMGCTPRDYRAKGNLDNSEIE